MRVKIAQCSIVINLKIQNKFETPCCVSIQFNVDTILPIMNMLPLSLQQLLENVKLSKTRTQRLSNTGFQNSARFTMEMSYPANLNVYEASYDYINYSNFPSHMPTFHIYVTV